MPASPVDQGSVGVGVGGVEWSGVEWSGVEWSEWSGVGGMRQRDYGSAQLFNSHWASAFAGGVADSAVRPTAERNHLNTKIQRQ